MEVIRNVSNSKIAETDRPSAWRRPVLVVVPRAFRTILSAVSFRRLRLAMLKLAARGRGQRFFSKRAPRHVAANFYHRSKWTVIISVTNLRPQS